MIKIEQRLARLERETRVLRLVVIAAVGGLVLIAAGERDPKRIVLRSDDGRVETVVTGRGMTITRDAVAVASLSVHDGDDDGRIMGEMCLREVGAPVRTTVAPGSLMHVAGTSRSEIALDRFVLGDRGSRLELSRGLIALNDSGRGAIQIGSAAAGGALGITIAEDQKLVAAMGSQSLFVADPSLRTTGAILLNDFRAPGKSGSFTATGFEGRTSKGVTAVR